MSLRREIIFLQLGGCGNHLGHQFWDTITKEHKLNDNGIFTGNIDHNLKYGDYVYYEKMDTYFKERGRGINGQHVIQRKVRCKHYVPRAILIDDDPKTLDKIKASSMGNLFNLNNYITASGFSSKRWSEHYYMTDTDMIDNSMNIIRNEVESCDCFQGFQFCHNIADGIGSGFTSLLLQRLHDFYPNTMKQTFTIYPSLKKTQNTNIYNSILCMNKLIENANQTFVIDNDALLNILINVLNQQDPTYGDLNWIGHLAMNHVTAHFRYNIDDYPLNTTIRNMGMNLVPFPKLHFLLLSYAPLFIRNDIQKNAYAFFDGDSDKRVRKVSCTSYDELNYAAWAESNFYANIQSKDGKYLCVSHLWRGAGDIPQFMDYNAKLEMMMDDKFVSWIPNLFKYSLHSPSVTGIYPHSFGIIANTTAIKQVYERMNKYFDKVFKNKQSVYLYRKDGMEDIELEISNNNIKDLCMEYQDKQNIVVDLVNDDGDENEEDEDEEIDGDEDGDVVDKDNH